MPKPLVLGPQRRTNPFIWCSAIICALLAIIVIFAGIVVFSGYLIIRPKLPLLSVPAARLDRVSYDQAGVLAVQLTIIIKAENHNLHAHASFDDTKFTVGYHGISIAHLVADPFDVEKNKTVDLNYIVESSPIPLSPEKQYLTQESLNRSQKMMFFLKGNSRTRWRVGPLGSVKFWLHMNCELVLPINGSVVYSPCTTKPHR